MTVLPTVYCQNSAVSQSIRSEGVVPAGTAAGLSMVSCHAPFCFSATQRIRASSIASTATAASPHASLATTVAEGWAFCMTARAASSGVPARARAGNRSSARMISRVRSFIACHLMGWFAYTTRRNGKNFLSGRKTAFFFISQPLYKRKKARYNIGKFERIAYFQNQS